MAKNSMVERDRKRRKLAQKYAAKRERLKAIIDSPESSVEERFEAQLKLQQIPRNASPVRQRNRCAKSGRPRGYYRKFGLARNELRRAAMNGEIPGLTLSSW
ncbi:MAG: 30S ribosomal protein S14 [Halorhodospira halophila]|uniref:30S ribosomal protein S14 n=1 Tax=Halorhodospira TaxID=85108 RepID=UPI0019124DDE|nr:MULTISPECIES: 30S ribosomal protein S14 [Halorhodospira]MBK5935595.1 30S ribosomal protein S14 [Halorhodospira halophila]MBK5943111.1 30S ribosomal protein S14 [Halorhodospira halophila]MCC3750878.1 30S ribosomal protein S14 [Halorhodospira halophila]MCG5528926.1 30S ribosomal protein S14 [Halorhodospira halophila]MCG5533753.1 30S ribosomal protein S14 [Halorhodospira sp. 9621]